MYEVKCSWYTEKKNNRISLEYSLCGRNVSLFVKHILLMAILWVTLNLSFYSNYQHMTDVDNITHTILANRSVIGK